MPTKKILYVGHSQSLDRLQCPPKSHLQYPLTWPEIMRNDDLGKKEWEIIEQCNLTQRQKRCIELKFFRKKTYREVGEELGISHTVVFMHVERARKKLKNRLTK